MASVASVREEGGLGPCGETVSGRGLGGAKVEDPPGCKAVPFEIILEGYRNTAERLPPLISLGKVGPTVRGQVGFSRERPAGC